MPSKRSTKQPKMVSFAEYRQIQRIKEAAHLGPGATDYTKPFGSDVHHKMHFGGKYIFKPDSNPPVGLYEPDQALGQTKPKIKSAIIKQPPQFAIYM